jgi:hypothetical protein
MILDTAGGTASDRGGCWGQAYAFFSAKQGDAQLFFSGASGKTRGGQIQAVRGRQIAACGPPHG